MGEEGTIGRSAVDWTARARAFRPVVLVVVTVIVLVVLLRVLSRHGEGRPIVGTAIVVSRGLIGLRGKRRMPLLRGLIRVLLGRGSCLFVLELLRGRRGEDMHLVETVCTAGRVLGGHGERIVRRRAVRGCIEGIMARMMAGAVRAGCAATVPTRVWIRMYPGVPRELVRTRESLRASRESTGMWLLARMRPDMPRLMLETVEGL